MKVMVNLATSVCYSCTVSGLVTCVLMDV